MSELKWSQVEGLHLCGPVVTYGRLNNRRCVWYSGTKCVRLDSPESRVTCMVSACNDSCLVYLARRLVVHCIESQEAPQCPSSRLALRGFEHGTSLPRPAQNITRTSVDLCIDFWLYLCGPVSHMVARVSLWLFANGLEGCMRCGGPTKHNNATS